MAIARPILVRTLALLKELSREYGPVETHEIWEKLSDVIPDENLKMDVFKIMLSGGDIGYEFEIRYWDDNKNKIKAIKALRNWTEASLRDSKDAIDNAAKHVSLQI